MPYHAWVQEQARGCRRPALKSLAIGETAGGIKAAIVQCGRRMGDERIILNLIK